MPFMEIEISRLDPNPFQTRKSYDKDVAAAIAVSSIGRHGILQPPMVRPIADGRYQIAFGHGRVEAAKAAGFRKIDCRVEDLTDSEMKKYVLQENVLRSDLTEDEKMTALEQYRVDQDLDPEDAGFVSKLSAATGVPEKTIINAYFTKQVRNELKKRHISFYDAKRREKPPSMGVILSTQGLPEDEQIKLIVKAHDERWGQVAVQDVKTAMVNMDSEVKNLIYDPDTKISVKVIERIAELENPETQKAVISYIKTYDLGEKMAVSYIKRVEKEGLKLETRVINEAEEVLNEFQKVRDSVMIWGVHQYVILGEYQWLGKALKIFDDIEQQMRWLKALKVVK